MIGVIAPEREMGAVREFFELFKTPWEKWNSEKSYEVVLCTTGESPWNIRADLIVVYSGTRLAWDPESIGKELPARSTKILCYEDREIPVYGSCITFPDGDSSLLIEKISGYPTVLRRQRGEQEKILRVGYDLFEEVRFLLTCGQPVEQAGIPALELHIEFLRAQLQAAGIAFVEIPPVPKGYRFIVCLTHDVDHPFIRKHKWDHTAVGFLYRAVIGSLRSYLAGSIPIQDLLTNWAAAFRLPLVYLGLAKDFWKDFATCYRDLEKDLPSTYFIIPFRDIAGRDVTGMAPTFRAARYCAQDVAGTIAEVAAWGCEVGLHGIDAWLDSSAATKELKAIQQLSRQAETGSRMHWLYFNENSPSVLEEAGISYDSTIGFRETVGFRAGTAQAYKPLNAKRILELPLHAMDTALFYPGYLGLSSNNATKVLKTLVDQVERFGGCLTINWHDRSLAPERLWYACYQRLLDDLKDRGAWFATCGQAIAWFGKRRSATFRPEGVNRELCTGTLTGSSQSDCLPELQLWAHGERLQSECPESGSFMTAPV